MSWWKANERRCPDIVSIPVEEDVNQIGPNVAYLKTVYSAKDEHYGISVSYIYTGSVELRLLHTDAFDINGAYTSTIWSISKSEKNVYIRQSASGTSRARLMTILC